MTNRVEHHVAHHFDSAEQEFDACKLGMWIFLVTEILMFGGLFVAYTVFRDRYDNTWEACANILSLNFGAANTVVLLISSFTMVLAVYAAQTDKQKMLKINLILTFLCAGTFMVNKAIEWSYEFENGVKAGVWFDFDGPGSKKLAQNDAGEHMDVDQHKANIFFGLYFTMTGLHGIHVLIGMGLIAWIYLGSGRGLFYPGYFTPVEMVGLYWHIVDLIWIFLFPLFYLI